MCSTTGERLTRLRAAIDALAAGAGPGQAEKAGLPDQPGTTGETSDIAARLAQLWAMLAQLDPELARRLPRYLA